MKSNFFLIFPLLWLGQSTAMTLPEKTVKSYDCDSCDFLSRTPLTTHWSIKNEPLGVKTQHQQQSLKYQQEVTLQQLQQGVSIHSLAPGAILRIVPLGKPLKGFKPQFSIQKDNKELSLADASALMANNEALDDTAFIDNPVAVVQLKPELGSGKFLLRENSANSSSTNFLISVLDQGSNTYLSVETDKSHYQYGDELIALFSLHDEVTSFPIDSIDVSLTNTDGEVTPLTLEKQADDVYKAQVKLDSTKNPLGKNWYVEANISSIVDKQTVNRHVHTAFSYAIPSAAVTEIKKSQDSSGFTANLTIATASRYSLQATIYATDKNGKKQAVEEIQTSAWFDPGQVEMFFAFPEEIKQKYQAPYYIGALQLVDYGQFKPVYEYNTLIEISKLE